MSTFKTSGFDKLTSQLGQIEKDVNELGQTPTIPFDDCFPSSFMRKYTSFSSIYELLRAGGFNVESDEDFDAIPEDVLDKHIASTTKFCTWEDMLEEATAQYIENSLEL